MVFSTSEWRMVSQHYPLLVGEIANLRQRIQEDALVVHALILWGEVLQARFLCEECGKLGPHNHCPECGSTEYNGTETCCLACGVRAYQEMSRV